MIIKKIFHKNSKSGIKIIMYCINSSESVIIEDDISPNNEMNEQMSRFSLFIYSTIQRLHMDSPQLFDRQDKKRKLNDCLSCH